MFANRKLKNVDIIAVPKIFLESSIKDDGSVKKATLKKLVQNQARNKFYTYRSLDQSIELISYQEADILKFIDKKPYLLPLPELCRAHYLLKGYKDHRIYILFDHHAIVVINEGRVKNYEVVKDTINRSAERQLLESASSFEVNLSVDGMNSGFVADQLKDSMRADLLVYQDQELFKSIDPNQFIKVDAKNSDKEGNSLVAVIGAVALINTAILGYVVWDSSQTAQVLKAQSEKIQENIFQLTMQVAELKQSSAENKEGNKNDKPSGAISSELNNKLSTISADIRATQTQLTQLKADLMGSSAKQLCDSTLETSGLANQALGDFFCKVLIEAGDEITCLYKGQSVRIGKTYTALDGFEVLYSAKKRAFIKRDGIRLKETPLSVANRGF